MVLGNLLGKLTPVIVVFRVTNIKETTTQKYSHTHKNHTIHYTYRHTHSFYKGLYTHTHLLILKGLYRGPPEIYSGSSPFSL